MKIHGKEIGFALTIGASVEIAKMCPNGDIRKIGELLDGNDYTKTVEVSTKLIKLMNDGFCGIERINGRTAEPLTEEEILLFTPKELHDVTAEVMKTFVGDTHGEVETELKNVYEGAQ